MICAYAQKTELLKLCRNTLIEHTLVLTINNSGIIGRLQAGVYMNYQ